MNCFHVMFASLPLMMSFMLCAVTLRFTIWLLPSNEYSKSMYRPPFLKSRRITTELSVAFTGVKNSSLVLMFLSARLLLKKKFIVLLPLSSLLASVTLILSLLSKITTFSPFWSS